MGDRRKRIFSNASVVVVILFFIGLCIQYTYIKYGNDMQSNTMVDDAEAAAAFAHEMIDYKLPSGYYEYMGQKQGASNILVIKRENSDSSEIVLIENVQEKTVEQFSSGELNIEQLAKEIQDERHSSMKLFRSYETEINGEMVKMYEYSGVDEDGNEIIQCYSDLFSGKRHPMIIILTGLQNEWNRAEIESFLNSITI